jgi:predicted transglutaminase-like cysteine proteinase
MEARHVLIAFLVAFGVAASAAAWTTATHVNATASSVGQPGGHATLDRSARTKV